MARDVVLSFMSTESPHAVSGKTTDMLVGAAFYDTLATNPAHRGRLIGRIHTEAGPALATGRNSTVREFLSIDDAQWLVMVDSDMVGPDHAVHWLLDCCEETERPIVGGVYLKGNGWACTPTIMSFHPHANGRGHVTVPVRDYPRDQLLSVDVVATGFLAVHRRVFEAIGGNWFDMSILDANGEPFGEDVAFCIRARHHGFPIHAHAGLGVGHHKSIVLTDELYRAGIPASLNTADAAG